MSARAAEARGDLLRSPTSLPIRRTDPKISAFMERGTDIDRAGAVLRAGGLVAFPTETVYGLGADASRDDAVARIFAVKGRPRAHPLIVHLGRGAAIDDWAVDVPEPARRLVASAWPGPLTVILRRGPRVAPAVTGGAPTVGLRMPAHPMALALIERTGSAIAAPSANRFGAVSPTTADHVAADLGDDVDYILDGGPCAVGVESTIVDLSRAHPVLLRPGGLPREMIEPLVGPLLAADAGAPAAPGTLASHYAPHARVVAVEPRHVPEQVALALAELRGGAELRKALTGVDAGDVVGDAELARRIAVLAPAAAFDAWPALLAVARKLPDDLAGIARELYAALRDLDAAGVDVVIAALPPAVGLGEAVADRLRRSAGPRERDET